MTDETGHSFIVRAGTDRVRDAIDAEPRTLIINRERMTVAVYATSRKQARQILNETVGAPADDVRIEDLATDR